MTLPDGQYGVICYYYDSTKLREAEAAVRASEERFRSVLDNSVDCIYRLNLQTGRYEYISPSAETIVGYSPDDMLRAGCQTAFAMIHPDDLPAFRAVLTRMEEIGTAEVEYRQRAKSGDYRWISNHMSLTKDSAGVPWYRDGNIRDITESKLREERIAKLTRLYAVLSRVNEAIVRADDAESLYAEVCRVVVEQGGFPLAWIGQVKEQQVVPVASWGPAADYLKEIRVEVQGELGGGPTGTCIREDRPVVNDDFAVSPAIVPWRQPALGYGFRASAAFPLRRQGKAIGAITLYSRDPNAFDAEQVALLEALSTDLSYALDALDHEQIRVRVEQGLRQAAKGLARSNKDLEQFAYVASHDLKEPLRMVTGFMSLLKDRCQGKLDAKADEYIVFAAEAAARMQRLIDDLLTYSRAGRGKVNTPTNVGAVVDRVLRSLTVSIRESSAVVTHDPLPTITSNAVELTQVFQNLIGNALKFKGERSRKSIVRSGRRAAGCSRSATMASASTRSLQTASS